MSKTKICVVCKEEKPRIWCFDGNVPYCMDCCGRHNLEDGNFEEQLRFEPDDFQVYNNNEASDYP